MSAFTARWVLTTIGILVALLQTSTMTVSTAATAQTAAATERPVPANPGDAGRAEAVARAYLGPLLPPGSLDNAPKEARPVAGNRWVVVYHGVPLRCDLAYPNPCPAPGLPPPGTVAPSPSPMP